MLTDSQSAEKTPNSIMNKATSKMIEEKKQREHLLQLNQILAKQVMEMSKIVAGIYKKLFFLHAFQFVFRFVLSFATFCFIFLRYQQSE